MSERVLGLDAFDTTAGAEEGSVMEVRSPKDGAVLRWPDGRPWTVTYYGSDSERVMRLAQTQADRRAQVMMRTRMPQTTAANEKDNIDLLVAATKTWDIPLSDGTPAKPDPKEYRAAYSKYKWLFEQGNEYAGLRSNFLKASPSD